MVSELPTFYRHELSEAEHTAARLELNTEHPYEVVRVPGSGYEIRPGRIVQAASKSIGAMSHG